MEARAFFAGRVTVRPLAATDQPKTRPEVQARILTPNGELAVLSDAKNPIAYLAALELLPGKARGHHFHKSRQENFYLISGKVQMHVQDVATGEQLMTVLNPGDLAFIEPGIAHAFLPLDSGTALEFSRQFFDETDVYRHPIDLTGGPPPARA